MIVIHDYSCVIHDCTCSPSSAFHWHQNTWTWMTLNVHYTLKYVLTPLRPEFFVWLSETSASANKDNCVLSAAIMPRTYFWRYKISADIRRVPIETPSLSDNNFQCLRSLCLRNLQRYGQLTVCIPRRLSMHYPKNTWPWMTLSDHFIPLWRWNILETSTTTTRQTDFRTSLHARRPIMH